MPVIRNVSGSKVCMQRGAVVGPGKTLYVQDLSDQEVASAIACGIFVKDEIQPDQPAAADAKTADSPAVPDLSDIVVPKRNPGKIYSVVDGMDVYSPNEMSEDEYDVVDGVKVPKEDTSPKVDPDIFIEIG